MELWGRYLRSRLWISLIKVFARRTKAAASACEKAVWGRTRLRRFIPASLGRRAEERRTLMRNWHWLAVAAAVALSFGVLEWHAGAQTRTGDKDDNPVVANCNTIPDTIPEPSDPKNRIITPIDATLLTSGQPCQ